MSHPARGEGLGKHILVKSINLKVNVIARQDFEFASYNVIVNYATHYITETTSLTALLILFHPCTSKTLRKGLQKKDENSSWMLRAVLHKSWKKHPKNQQRYGHLLPILQTIQERRSKTCWRKEENISDVLLWISTHGYTGVVRLANTYTHQLCEDTWCHLEDLPRAKADKDGLWEVVKRIRAVGCWWSRVRQLN